MAELKIHSLGRQGDGIATDKGAEVFVPFTLPGETVQVHGNTKRRTVNKLITEAPDRASPICEHFESCGGCQLQHMQDDAYLNWKRELVGTVLTKVGIETEVEPVIAFPVASRRKAVFNACRIDGQLVFGFARYASNDVIDIKQCPVLVEGLESSLPTLKKLAASLPLGRKSLRISVLLTSSGLDVELDGSMRLTDAQRKALLQKSMVQGIARFSLGEEILIEVRKPTVPVGIAQAVPPPGGFVQASASAEQVMSELVAAHLAPCKTVTDLFSGIGTFALRLAENSTVFAVEQSAAALSSLDRAWRETGGKLKQIKTEARNLDRRPVSFQELKKFEGLVFDPPRAGAEMQVKQIAKSRVKRVAAVSCNPVTLARDLRILMDGGYQLKRVVPIDQFRFTPHIEVVALLER